ncbi:FAD-binding oxidoreductase [Devosia algicola]
MPTIKPLVIVISSFLFVSLVPQPAQTGKVSLFPISACDYGAPMSLPPSQIIAALAAIVGPAHLISQPQQMGPYLNEPRKRFHQPALAVVLPGAVAEVQAIARYANANGVALIPQGGNTGLVGAQVPLSGHEVIISLARLNGVRNIDVAAGTMTVEAGLILEEAHKAAEAEGAMFPLWIASQGSARIGGVLSSNAGGVNVLAYGNARELCMGVEAVLADGRLYNGLTSLKKDNTGYDLKDLLVGAEGTLGIITAATLKIFVQPEDYETALVSLTSPDAALTLFQAMRERTGARLNAFELIPWIGLDIQLRHKMLDADPTADTSPWYGLIEVSRMKGGPTGTLQAALETAFEQEWITNAVLAESLADRTHMWAFREQMSECQSREGASIKHDVSVPIANVPALIAEGIKAVEHLVPGIRAVPFGHMGDGNIHFNFSQPVGADPKTFRAGADPIHTAIYEIVLKLGGSVSAEHGIGQLKTELLKQVKDPVALEMMHAIKQALDPNNILNPGKMLT